MENLLNNAVSSELLFVYGLILLVIILIIVIIIIDKKESKKKPQNLFDTLNMKIIANPDEVEKDIANDTEVLEINNKESTTSFEDLEPVKQVEVKESNDLLKETIKSIGDEVYHDDELDKTQAQIRIEEITKALENAQVDEHIEEDKYKKFEEEQEKNAIISYNELKQSFDKLYSENEKIQYVDDDEIPINIDELYSLKDKEDKKVKLDDFTSIKVEQPKKEETTPTFKNSPLISPVYGIQKPEVHETTKNDKDIEDANEFLQRLKELKSSLE